MNNWAVSLTLRGFEQSKDIIAQILDSDDYKIGLCGEAVKPGVETLLKKSYIRFSVEFSSPPNIFDIVPAIISHSGGADYLCTAREEIQPEYTEINIVMPIKQSLEQEGGFISKESIKDIERLCASLSFEFLEA
jgi:hypothetical protein